jgi:protein SCO1/2
MIRRVALLLTACAIAAAAAFAVVSVMAAGAGTPHGPVSAGTPAPDLNGSTNRRVPHLALVGESGRRTSLAALRGRWVVLTPALTLCHEVCPLTTGALLELRRRLRRQGLSDRVTLAEITVDPWRDTPGRLRAYRRLVGLRGVRLFTGSHAQIKRLWDFFGVYFRRVPQGNPPDMDWLTGKPEHMDVQHTDALFVLDPRGHERAATVGMPDVGGRLAPKLRKLLNESGQANLRRPNLPWTPARVMAALRRLGLGAS